MGRPQPAETGPHPAFERAAFCCKEYQVTWQNGLKVGEENHWDEHGRRVWQWQHRADGTSAWTQFRADGSKRHQSTWRGLRCHGPARAWDAAGRISAEYEFQDGVMVP